MYRIKERNKNNIKKEEIASRLDVLEVDLRQEETITQSESNTFYFMALEIQHLASNIRQIHMFLNWNSIISLYKSHANDTSSANSIKDLQSVLSTTNYPQSNDIVHPWRIEASRKCTRPDQTSLTLNVKPWLHIVSDMNANWIKTGIMDASQYSQ